MAKILGMGGFVDYGSSVPLPVTNWTADIANELQDVTDTGSGGWRARIAGVSTCDVTFDFFFGQNAGADALTVGSTVNLDLDAGVSGVACSGTFIVGGFSINNPATAPVTISCTCSNSGAVTFT